ncbi:MAG: ATP-binding protein, partial [Gammaproteobacteria bacterium]
LAAAAVLLIALISSWLVNDQHAKASAILEQRELGFHAKTVGNTLQSLARRIGEVANNPIIATALVDSAGRELYLQPFLHGLRQVNGVPVQATLTDFEGKPIASNGAQSFSNEELAWLREQMARDNDQATIFEGGEGARLVGVEFMRYSRTATPEGALIYKVKLADLAPAPWTSLAWEGQSTPFVAKSGLRSTSLSVPPNMTRLHLRLEADPRALSLPLKQPDVQYLGIAAVSLALAGVVYLVGARLADGLTVDLRRLEAFSSKLGDDIEAPQHVELIGSTEVTSLARSINRMLDRLYEQRTHLENERQRFYQLANTIPQLAWMAEPDGNITWYNDRWYAYTGTQPRDMEHGGWMKVHDPAALPNILREWKAALARGQPANMTFALRGADGRFRRFFTSVAPLRDTQGQIVQWFGTNTDLSQMEQAEQAVRRSEERLQQGLVAARMAVWEWSVVSGELTFSANLPSVFGAGFSNIGALWPLVDRADLAPLRDAIDAAVQRQGDYHALVRVQRADDGSCVWLDVRGRGGAPAEGIAAVHTIAIDVTERKRAEEALRQADQRKDEFLAMLAHELRNPLAPIGSAAAMLGLAYAHEGRIRQVSDIIGRQVAHMTRLVDDLLDVSRVTRGLVTIQRELADLRPIASEALEQVRPLAEARRQNLQASLPEQAVWVRCDRTRVVQVITNLLSNSVKYSPVGGHIELTLELQRGQAVLRVRDNGVGIHAELLPHVFELFTQGKRTLDRSEGGLGLGLALVRKLVELHGGTVSADSPGEGQGSTFTVQLPLDMQTADAPALPAPAHLEAAERSLRLLVVDDNRDAADLLAMLLQVDGHDAVAAYSGQAALEISARASFDALMLDIGMPDMDGYTLARQLRAAGVPGTLVAVTGYGQEQDKARTREAGFAAHLVKPIDPQALAQLLEQLQRDANAAPRAAELPTLTS